MINHASIVDYIEEANDRRPYCECGRNTEPVYRDGAIWLDCTSLREPAAGRLARLLAIPFGPVHVHDHLMDAPAGA